jgi:pSer/pThr/pTyr-binding forkhead associated (FHA) protein
MLTCKECEQENPPDARFCSRCGTKLANGEAEKTLSFAPVEVEEEEAAISAELPEEGALLAVQKGPNVGESFTLSKPETSLGRDPQSDIFLNDITVSRKHAIISLKNGVFFLADAGSLNGTYLNSTRIEVEALKHKDEIQIGKFKLIFLEKGNTT